MIAAVTGATGFVGRALVAALLAEGYTVRALVRPGVAPDRRARIEHLGAELVPGELGEEVTVEGLVRGADVVFHAAAAVGAWQPRALCEAVNLVGTEVLLDACRAGGAKRLVYVSCASVTAGLGHRRYVDESHPHPARFPDAYHSTKALAEDLVVAASGSGFDTVVVRPGQVWGPDDTSCLVRMLGLAAHGALPLVDDGEALAATTYIVNLVDVLLRAATRPEAPGQVYFVTDDEMVRQRVFVTRLFGAVGVPAPRRRALFWPAYLGAWWDERRHAATARTRSEVIEAGRAAQLNIQRVRDALGYRPVVNLETGFARVKQWVDATGLDAVRAGAVALQPPAVR